jgi:hypothetical protein
MYDNGRGCIVQGYNAQLAVDGQRQVIVAAEVTQDALDRGQLLTMMKSTERNAGQRPDVFTADAGYWDTRAVHQAIHGGAQVLVPPDGATTLKTGQLRQMANNPLAQQMRAELTTEDGRSLYRMRQAVVGVLIGTCRSTSLVSAMSYRWVGQKLHLSAPRLPDGRGLVLRLPSCLRDRLRRPHPGFHGMGGDLHHRQHRTRGREV